MISTIADQPKSLSSGLRASTLQGLIEIRSAQSSYILRHLLAAVSICYTALPSLRYIRHISQLNLRSLVAVAYPSAQTVTVMRRCVHPN